MDLRFNVTRCIRRPEMEAVFKILKLRVDESRLVDTRVYEWRVVDLSYRGEVE